jgi:hypothetical protein
VNASEVVGSSKTSGVTTVVDTGVSYDSVAAAPVAAKTASAASNVRNIAATSQSNTPVTESQATPVATAQPLQTSNDVAPVVAQPLAAAASDSAEVTTPRKVRGEESRADAPLRYQHLEGSSLAAMIDRFSSDALVKVQQGPTAATPASGDAQLLKFLDQMAGFHSGAGIKSLDTIVARTSHSNSHIAQLAASR